jgi:NAD-dependent protein deacetylase/lipoamidase
MMGEKGMDSRLTMGAKMIQESDKIMVFTGAGLSTESGIPDFRSPGGIWEKYDPSDFYFQKIISDTNAREKYWEMSSAFYEPMKNAQPNTAHLAIKILEDAGKLLSIVTQNIDHLHHKAGNHPDNIIELHGTAFSVSCLNCKKNYGRDAIEHRLQTGIKAPSCDDCGGILKPDTISFGQSMPEEKMARSINLAEECDLCMVLGSSLVVQPAAFVPAHAARSGALLLIINRDPTPLDGEADLVIKMSVCKALENMTGQIFP